VRRASVFVPARAIDYREYLTFDAFKYLSRLETDIPDFDGIAKQYLKDALASFRIGAYLSSAVMSGVAAERCEKR